MRSGGRRRVPVTAPTRAKSATQGTRSTIKPSTVHLENSVPTDDEQNMNPSKILAPSHIVYNAAAADFVYVLVSIMGGCVCGILGFTGMSGFYFFALMLFAVFSVIMYRIDLKPFPYFTSWTTIAFGSLSSSILTFVLFWTMMYNIVHIY